MKTQTLTLWIHVSAHHSLNPVLAKWRWLVCTKAKFASLSAMPLIALVRNIKEFTIKNQPKTFNVWDRKFSNDVGKQRNYPFLEESLQHEVKSHIKENLATILRFFLVMIMEQSEPKQTPSLSPIHTRVYSFNMKGAFSHTSCFIYLFEEFGNLWSNFQPHCWLQAPTKAKMEGI